MPTEIFIHPSIARAVAHVTGKEAVEVQELASIVSEDVTLVDFVETLTEPPCSNAGCDRPRSNYSDECFECRFEPFGSEWQREQEERR